MKTAEEITQDILFDYGPHHKKEGHELYCPDCKFCENCAKEEIEEALNDFADEMVRKAVVESFGPEYRKIRNEALEDAAKVVESAENEAGFDEELLHSADEFDLPKERDWIAKAIRALKIEKETITNEPTK